MKTIKLPYNSICNRVIDYQEPGKIWEFLWVMINWWGDVCVGEFKPTCNEIFYISNRWNLLQQVILPSMKWSIRKKLLFFRLVSEDLSFKTGNLSSSNIQPIPLTEIGVTIPASLFLLPCFFTYKLHQSMDLWVFFFVAQHSSQKKFFPQFLR